MIKYRKGVAPVDLSQVRRALSRAVGGGNDLVSGVHREQAARRPHLAGNRVARSDLRALVVLIYVVAGSSLILTSAGPMTLMLTSLLVGLEPSDLAYEIVGRLGVGLSIVGLALIGALIAGERPPLEARSALVTGTAFPAGAGALTLVLASAWIGGVAVSMPHDVAFDSGLFGLGTMLTLLGVLGEELLIRGLLQPVLVRTWGALAGIVVAALAFMVIHMVGGWGHPVSLLNISLAGIWFGLLAYRTGGLLAPILAHFGYNWAEEMVFGASPNPGIGAFGSIVDVDLVGPTIWGGSVEGLNASLAVSIVLIALIIPLALASIGRTPSRGKAPAGI